MLILLFLPVTLGIKYDKFFSVYVKILFFKIPVFPGKKKKIDLSEYSTKSIEKRKKKKQKKDSVKKAKSSKANEKKRTYSDTVSLVEAVYDTVVVFLEKFPEKLKIKLADLDITVGSDNSATTALLFGAVNTAVISVVSLLEAFYNYDKCNNKNIRIRADFLAEKTVARVDLRFGINLFNVLASILHSAPKIKKLIEKI